MREEPADGPGDLGRLAARYDEDAGSYEATWAPVLIPYALPLLETMPLAGARRVLDAGAGVGALMPHLARAAPGALVAGVDASAGMIARAPGALPRAVMDLTRLGLETASFDAVVMAFVLFHLRDALRGLRESLRVLRDGGAFGAITWSGEPDFAAQIALIEELDRAGAERGDAVHADHEAVGAPGKMRGLLETAGFREIRAWTAPFEHAYEPESLIAIRMSRGHTRRRFASLDDPARAQVLARLRDRYSRMTPEEFTDRAVLTYAIAAR